jgi:hypothetical protein
MKELYFLRCRECGKKYGNTPKEVLRPSKLFGTEGFHFPSALPSVNVTSFPTRAPVEAQCLAGA